MSGWTPPVIVGSSQYAADQALFAQLELDLDADADADADADVMP